MTILTWLIPAGLALIGLINLAPGIVALFPARSLELYGLGLDTPALELVMRHRAVLLALIGAGLLVGAAVPGVRTLVIAAALISKFSFILLWWMTGDSGPALARIATVDLIAAPVLLLILALHLSSRPT
jgi:hypothetical protein